VFKGLLKWNIDAFVSIVNMMRFVAMVITMFIGMLRSLAGHNLLLHGKLISRCNYAGLDLLHLFALALKCS